jgi:hypothetical protein
MCIGFANGGNVVICAMVRSVVLDPEICDSAVISAFISSIVPTNLGLCKCSSEVGLRTRDQVKSSYRQEQRANRNVKTKAQQCQLNS